MKRIVYLILKNNPKAFQTLEEIKKHGYNATIMNTESLRHAVDDFPEEHHFYNLRHFENQKIQEGILCLIVVGEEKLEELKSLIRLYTNDFQDIRGGMFSKKLEDYEGSI